MLSGLKLLGSISDPTPPKLDDVPIAELWNLWKHRREEQERLEFIEGDYTERLKREISKSLFHSGQGPSNTDPSKRRPAPASDPRHQIAKIPQYPPHHIVHEALALAKHNEALELARNGSIGKRHVLTPDDISFIVDYLKRVLVNHTKEAVIRSKLEKPAMSTREKIENAVVSQLPPGDVRRTSMVDFIIRHTAVK